MHVTPFSLGTSLLSLSISLLFLTPTFHLLLASYWLVNETHSIPLLNLICTLSYYYTLSLFIICVTFLAFYLVENKREEGHYIYMFKEQRMAATIKEEIQDMSQELQTIYLSNLDEAPARRRAREAFKDTQLAIDHCLFRLPTDGVKMEEVYEVNSRGLKIFSKSWLPEKCAIKAIVCYCHGYADTCTFYFEGVARKLASSGYAVFALDYPGFGLSDGLHGYIPNFENLVNDVVEHFSKIKEQKKYKDLPSFLMGESMGGAIALKIHFKQPNAWDGAALIAPLCKFAEDMIPHWLVKQILIGVAKVLPKTKLVPQKEEVKDNIFRDANKRKLAPYNVLLYKDKPRLGTALELLKATQNIEQRLDEVCLPLLIMHGEADIITDPSASKALYEKAKVNDKKLCLYKDAFHTLLEGEPDETIFHVLGDIISWLDDHSNRKNKY